MRFLIPGLLASAALAAPFGPPFGGFPGHHGGPHGFGGKAAAYFLDDNPANGSSIIALAISADGTLSDPVRTSTNGMGAVAVSDAGVPNQQDPLNSQSAIVVSGNMIFTINTGSDTLVMFRINPQDPLHPMMVGSPVGTMGEFPVSVTYSEELHMVCVLNGGAKDGVACFHADPFHGLQAVGGLRSLGMAINETTPPTSPPLSASQVLFTPDSSAVLALVKGDAGTTPVTPSYIVAFGVEHGIVSDTPVFTSFTDIPMIFGSVFFNDGKLFSAAVTFGAAVLDVGSDLKVTVDDLITVPGQVAICWATYDAELSTGYLPDAGMNVITKINADSYAIEGEISITTSNATGRGPGVFDSAVANNKLYGLAAEPGIVVVDLQKSEQIQFLDLDYFGNRQGWTGIALYP